MIKAAVDLSREKKGDKFYGEKKLSSFNDEN